MYFCQPDINGLFDFFLAVEYMSQTLTQNTTSGQDSTPPDQFETLGEKEVNQNTTSGQDSTPTDRLETLGETEDEASVVPDVFVDKCPGK